MYPITQLPCNNHSMALTRLQFVAIVERKKEWNQERCQGIS